MAATDRLCDYAAAELSRLAAEGIAPTPAEVVELNALCSSSGTAEERVALSRGRPVRVGGAVLWPPTLRAYAWLEAGGWTMGPYALAWAMAHAYSSEHPFDAPPEDTRAAIRAWQNTLDATPQAVAEAVACVVEADQEGDAPDDRTDERKAEDAAKPAPIGDLVARLVAAVGGTPELWESRVSASYARRQLDVALEQASADGRRPAEHARIRRERAIALCLARIRRRAAEQSARAGEDCQSSATPSENCQPLANATQDAGGPAHG